MNISKHEQRVLHVLAQGGAIRFDRAQNGKVRAVSCITRDGLVLTDCTLPVFERLRRRRLIRSCGGHPYRITRHGLASVRAQLDNR
ncbi:YjhX family toxin [Salipiger bermudensis]|uniref:YjhX family toxin n=1 Tax=Salipiger bermudensis TaxID=344736 RepID=UPI001C995331|nr:YjhX family toxin [Salipiger bermudensis]MBY6006013.1 YjhX family toxin [Salipiger bermudensis]